ncbi:MAG: hypothetical protein LBG91_03275 [Treponema sp.]|jgi:hypothetical protein|nr:hypothetical protein [Treponema sp.]
MNDLRDRAISFGWIMGLLILTALLWILTQPLQAHYLLRTVNNVLVSEGDSRRVSAPLTQRGERTGLLGHWYSMYNSSDRMFVFSVFRDGILVPLGAVVSDNGNVEEIIPLSAHAEQALENIPESVMLIYVTRIRNAYIKNARIFNAASTGTGGKNR